MMQYFHSNDLNTTMLMCWKQRLPYANQFDTYTNSIQEIKDDMELFLKQRGK